MVKDRPAEAASLSTGTVVGAVFLILQGYGVKVPPAVPGAAVVLVGAVASAVTSWVSRSRKR